MWENVDFPYQKRNREKGTSKGVKVTNNVGAV